MTMSKTNIYLAVWDCYGLESLFNLTEWNSKCTYNILMELPLPPTIPYNQLLLRARMNSERNYEIYTFTTEEDVTEEMLRESFEVAPQYMVDHVRKNGHKLFCNRLIEDKRVVV